MSPIGPCVLTFSPQLVTLLGRIMELLGGGRQGALEGGLIASNPGLPSCPRLLPKYRLNMISHLTAPLWLLSRYLAPRQMRHSLLKNFDRNKCQGSLLKGFWPGWGKKDQASPCNTRDCSDLDKRKHRIVVPER